MAHTHLHPHTAWLISLQLGSGIGFMGLVIEKFGAEITITDIPELVPIMQKNIELNKSTR